jgi:hypothetical protein
LATTAATITALIAGFAPLGASVSTSIWIFILVAPFLTRILALFAALRAILGARVAPEDYQNEKEECPSHLSNINI